MIGITSPRTRGTGTRILSYLRLDRGTDRAVTQLHRRPRDRDATARLRAFLRVDRGHRA